MHGGLTTTITAGSELIRVVEEAKRAVKLAGQYVANGVGSTGKSSPVATAPAHAGSGECAYELAQKALETAPSAP